MTQIPIILDGSKFSWYNGSAVCDGMGRVDDHPGFPRNGRAPAKIAVRSPRTGAVVVFAFVEIADDDFGAAAFKYEGTLPDGRYCALSLAA